jgi:hypothetical protein
MKLTRLVILLGALLVTPSMWVGSWLNASIIQINSPFPGTTGWPVSSVDRNIWEGDVGNIFQRETLNSQPTGAVTSITTPLINITIGAGGAMGVQSSAINDPPIIQGVDIRLRDFGHGTTFTPSPLLPGTSLKSGFGFDYIVSGNPGDSYALLVTESDGNTYFLSILSQSTSGFYGAYETNSALRITSFELFGINAPEGGIEVDNIEMAQSPEPAALVLTGGGLIGLGLCRRRRRNTRLCH